MSRNGRRLYSVLLLLEVLEESALLTFLPRVAYPVGMQPRSTSFGDFNNDGVLDLVIPNSEGASVSVLLGNGDGSFKPAATYPTGAGPHFVAIDDFNNDGNLDFITFNSFEDTRWLALAHTDKLACDFAGDRHGCCQNE